VIVPSASINCTGRITGIAVSMEWIGLLTENYPIIQIWHPSSPGSSVYNRISQATVSLGTREGNFGNFYYIYRFPVTNFIDFQPGDVIGYYQPSQPRRVIWNIQTSGYTSYSNSVNSPSNTIDINNVDHVERDQQPLIELQFGKDILIVFVNGIVYIFIKNCFAMEI